MRSRSELTRSILLLSSGPSELAAELSSFRECQAPNLADLRGAVPKEALAALEERLAWTGLPVGGSDPRLCLVAHGWAGPLALAWAARNPGRIGELVLINTTFWPPRDPGRLSRFWLQVRGEDFPKEWLGERWSAFLADAWQRHAPGLVEMPALLIWGMKDRFLTHRDLERWQGVFRHHVVLPVPGMGAWPRNIDLRTIGTAIRGFLEMPRPAREIQDSTDSTL